MAKISIKFPSGNEPRSLETTVKKQLSIFLKKNTRVAEADVKLVYGTNITSEKICEIYLKTEDKNMFTIQTASSFESSLVKSIKKLQSQLNNIYNNIEEAHGKIETEQQ